MNIRAKNLEFGTKVSTLKIEHQSINSPAKKELEALYMLLGGSFYKFSSDIPLDKFIEEQAKFTDAIYEIMQYLEN